MIQEKSEEDNQSYTFVSQRRSEDGCTDGVEWLSVSSGIGIITGQSTEEELL